MTGPDPDLTRVREAWQHASPAEVVRGLNNPKDYPPAMRAIIQEVAEQRGIDADREEDAAAPETFVPLRRVASGIKPRLHALLRVVQSHPFVSGLILGILCPACSLAVHKIFASRDAFFHIPLFVFLYLVGLVVICLPVRRYRTVILAAAGASLGEVGFTMARLLYYAAQGLPGVFSRRDLLMLVLLLALVFAIPCVSLAVVVWTRNRYSPVHEPGRCRVCEYDLRGLPEPRCPECGTPFDPSGIALLLSGDSP